MTLPVSGAISLGDVNVELQRSATATISMNDAELRTLFAVPSGAIGLATGYGKANKFVISITSNQTNLDLRSWLISQGWNESSNVEVTINSGVWLSSDSTSIAGLRVSGSFPNGLKITNNGYIVGMGGAGGAGTAYTGSAGGAGGAGLFTSVALTMVNNGTIAGGGGGGGAGGAARNGDADTKPITYAAGGGGGGGRSGLINSGGAKAGTSSAPGGSTAGGSFNRQYQQYSQYYDTAYAGTGAGGGGWGSSGGTGTSAYTSSGRVLYYGSNPSYFQGGAYGGGAGGSGGAAVQGNSYITWTTTGTRYGSLT